MDSILWFSILISWVSLCSPIIFTKDSETNDDFYELSYATGLDETRMYTYHESWKRKICELLIENVYFADMGHKYVKKNTQIIHAFADQCPGCVLDHRGENEMGSWTFYRVLQKNIRIDTETVVRRNTFACLYSNPRYGYGELFVSDSYVADTFLISERQGRYSEELPYIGIAEMSVDKNTVEPEQGEQFFMADYCPSDRAHFRLNIMSLSRRLRLCRIVYDQLYHKERITNITGSVLFEHYDVRLSNVYVTVAALGCVHFGNERTPIYYLTLSRKFYQRIYILNAPVQESELTISAYSIDKVPTLNPVYP